MTYRDTVREIALNNFSYVTTEQAQESGVPPVELRKLASRKSLENVAYGIYRVADLPATPFDQFAEAILRAGHGAYLYGESVLALHSLADVNPRRIIVATNRRTRPKYVPDYIKIIKTKDMARTVYNGLASQKVADAILACKGSFERSRLLGALDKARDDGLVTYKEYLRVKRELKW